MNKEEIESELDHILSKRYYVNSYLKEDLLELIFKIQQGKKVECPSCKKVEYNPRCDFCNEHRYLPEEDRDSEVFTPRFQNGGKP